MLNFRRFAAFCGFFHFFVFMSFLVRNHSSAGAASAADRGGQKARPPPAWKGAGHLCADGRGPGLSLLPAKRPDSQKSADRLLAQAPYRKRLSGNLNARDFKPHALGDFRPLGALPREYVHDCHRRCGLCHQADELSRRHAGLQNEAAFIPGAAAARGGAWPDTPQ